MGQISPKQMKTVNSDERTNDEEEIFGYGMNVGERGDYYIGSWRNGNRLGFGKQVHEDGIVVEGEWYDDDFLVQKIGLDKVLYLLS